MIRSLRVVAGFELRPAVVASTRLRNAVAASLAVGCLSVCLILTLTLLTLRVASAMPLS
jgi:hypothetical protein